jgi:hypothetical protein
MLGTPLQLIVLQQTASGRLQLMNGGSLILGDPVSMICHPSSMPSRLSGPTLSCVGFEPGSVGTGLEIPLAWKSTEDRCGTMRIDPADERGKSLVGAPPHWLHHARFEVGQPTVAK